MRKNLNPWTTNIFYFVPRHDSFSNPDAFAICSDPLVDALFVEPLTLYRNDSEPETTQSDD